MTIELIGIDIVLFFLIGLLGGAHCIGMCGPMVTVYASRIDPAKTDGGTSVSHRGARHDHLTVYEVRQHALFNIGRTVSYTLIGVVMGTLGGILILTVDQVTFGADMIRGVLGGGIGLLIVIIGLRYLSGRFDVGMHLPGSHLIAQRLMGMVDRLANSPGIAVLGAVHGLLPCPILYPAYLYAFTTGSPIAGGIALFTLGIGTIPAVFGYGTVVERVNVHHRKRLHQLLGIVFLILGYILFAHGLMSLGIHVPHPELPFWDGIELPHDVANGHEGH